MKSIKFQICVGVVSMAFALGCADVTASDFFLSFTSESEPLQAGTVSSNVAALQVKNMQFRMLRADYNDTRPVANLQNYGVLDEPFSYVNFSYACRDSTGSLYDLYSDSRAFQYVLRAPATKLWVRERRCETPVAKMRMTAQFSPTDQRSTTILPPPLYPNSASNVHLFNDGASGGPVTVYGRWNISITEDAAAGTITVENKNTTDFVRFGRKLSSGGLDPGVRATIWCQSVTLYPPFQYETRIYDMTNRFKAREALPPQRSKTMSGTCPSGFLISGVEFEGEWQKF